MNRRFFLGVFASEADFVGAVRAARARGWPVAETWTPYPVHGLPELVGVRGSRLPWVCFAFGLLGAAGKLWLQVWTSAMDWPVNVGGKPMASIPAYIPVTFEIMVLFAGFSTAAAFFLRSRLHPTRAAAMPLAGITDDRFVVAVLESDARFDAAAARRLFAAHHALQTSEHMEVVR
jgi:hypothetical protein